MSSPTKLPLSSSKLPIERTPDKDDHELTLDDSFGSDHKDGDNENVSTEVMERRKLFRESKARNTFNEAKKSTDGRDHIFRNLLARYGYTEFFVRGFSLETLDKQLVHLGK